MKWKMATLLILVAFGAMAHEGVDGEEPTFWDTQNPNRWYFPLAAHVSSYKRDSQMEGIGEHQRELFYVDFNQSGKWRVWRWDNPQFVPDNGLYYPLVKLPLHDDEGGLSLCPAPAVLVRLQLRDLEMRSRYGNGGSDGFMLYICNVVRTDEGNERKPVQFNHGALPFTSPLEYTVWVRDNQFDNNQADGGVWLLKAVPELGDHGCSNKLGSCRAVGANVGARDPYGEYWTGDALREWATGWSMSPPQVKWTVEALVACAARNEFVPATPRLLASCRDVIVFPIEDADAANS